MSTSIRSTGPGPSAARVTSRMMPGRHDAAEVRDEPGEEGQHGERHREGHAKDGHEQARSVMRDQERQHRGAPEVAAHASQSIVAGRGDPVALLLADRLERPDPPLVTVAQEEEDQEGGQDADRHGPGRRCHDAATGITCGGADGAHRVAHAVSPRTEGCGARPGAPGAPTDRPRCWSGVRPRTAGRRGRAAAARPRW